MFYKTRWGKLRFGLLIVGEEPYWFKQSPQEDRKHSRDILDGNQLLRFVVQIEETGDCPPHFIAYLRSNPERWHDDFAIPMTHSRITRGPAGERLMQYELGEDDGEAERKFRNRYWSGGNAVCTLCDNRRRPVEVSSDGVVQTEIKLGTSDPFRRRVHEALKRERREELDAAAIGSPFRDFLDIVEKARREASGSPILELYYRLMLAWPTIERLLLAIAARPDRQTVPGRGFYEFSRREATKFFAERGSNVEIERTLRYHQFAGRRVPTSFSAVTREHTTATPANRYVWLLIDRLEDWISEIRSKLLSHIESKKEAANSFIEQVTFDKLRKRLNQHLNLVSRATPEMNVSEREKLLERAKRVAEEYPTSPIYLDHTSSIKDHVEATSDLIALQDGLSQITRRLPDRPPLAGGRAVSSALSYNPRYSRLRRLAAGLSRLLEVSDSGEALQFEVAALSDLYERWCFVQVVEALLEIGFYFKGANGRSKKTPLYHHPVPHQSNATLGHSDLTSSFSYVRVWYDRRFCKYPKSGDERELPESFGLETRFRRTTYSEVDDYKDEQKPKVTPDITLEVHGRGQSFPTIVTLDPTISSKSKIHRKKFEYRKGIRYFHSLNSANNSPRVVQAAWAIYPGDSSTQKFAKPRDQHKEGTIVLRPDEGNESQDALPETLQTILEKIGVLSI